MIQLAANDSQHFAVGLHGLDQVLHNLHIQIPPDVGLLFSNLQGADAGGQFADGLHGLQDILLHSHIFTSEIRVGKVSEISRRSYSASRRKRTWT